MCTRFMRNVTIPRVIRCHMIDLSAHVVLMKTIFDYMFFFPWRRGPLNYACIECFCFFKECFDCVCVCFRKCSMYTNSLLCVPLNNFYLIVEDWFVFAVANLIFSQKRVLWILLTYLQFMLQCVHVSVFHNLYTVVYAFAIVFCFVHKANDVYALSM